MLSCLKRFPPPSTTENHYVSSPASQDNTPTSGVQLSPTVNLTREYTLAIQSNSFSEIRHIFDQDTSFDQTIDIEHIADVFDGLHLLDQVIRPSRERVHQTLSSNHPNHPFTRLITTYFEQSECASHLLLLLHQRVRRASAQYAPIHNLIDDFAPEEDLSHTQCMHAVNVFLEFDRLENPFLQLDSPHNFDNVRRCFSGLKQELQGHLKKSRARVDLACRFTKGCAICAIAAVIGVTVSAVVIASHAVVALVAGPICCPLILDSCKSERKVLSTHVAQLDAAAKGAYVLHHDLDTIDSLVASLHSAVETDKLSVHMAVERGVDRYLVQEVLRQMRRDQPNIVRQMKALEEHLGLCFSALNRARMGLLEEIELHQSRYRG